MAVCTPVPYLEDFSPLPLADWLDSKFLITELNLQIA
jgi:hypothetical protein